ncbi:MAG: UDP-glucose 4-epimerase [Verrucomicrobiales bacterium]|nr:UDP-glucose 4-epimerase [Verrucomicrobiales bacterium]
MPFTTAKPLTTGTVECHLLCKQGMAIQRRQAVALVTGAAGFIGSHVAAELLARGFRVVGLDDLSGGFFQNIPKGMDFVRGSIMDRELIEQLFRMEKFAYVFHFAAYAAENLSHFIRTFNYQNNVLGSINLINASVNSKAVKCFVFASSAAVYGETASAATEITSPRPADPYAIAKYAIELDLQAAARLFKLPFIIYRFHNVYGEKQNIVDPYRNVIGIFMKQILQGIPLTVFGDGSQTRSFTHISEVAPVVAASVTHKGALNQIFNLGSNRKTPVIELAKLVSNAMGEKAAMKFLPQRNECHTVQCSHAKARSMFGDLIQSIGLEDGLNRMAKWVREAGIPESKPTFFDIEVTDQLPASWRKALKRRPAK